MTWIHTDSFLNLVPFFQCFFSENNKNRLMQSYNAVLSLFLAESVRNF